VSTPITPDPRERAREASVGELFGEVSRDLSTLIRQEIALAKAEAKDSAVKVGTGAGMLAGAGWAMHFVLLFLSLALWWALAGALADDTGERGLGSAGLIVALVWAVIAAILALVGRSRLKRAKGLQQTGETVKKIPPALKGQEPS
jgi:hypothetical protein